MTCGVYSIQSPSGKLYIGSSKNIEKRWKQYGYPSYKKQILIYRSLLKHGYDNHIFQVIWECNEDELLQKEQMCIDFYKPELNCSKIVGRPPSYFGEKNSNWKGGITKAKDYHRVRKQKYYQEVLKPKKQSGNNENGGT